MAGRNGWSRERRFVWFALFLLLALIFPVYGAANRVEPFVLGLPFSLFWVVLWVAVEFVGLIVFYRSEGGRGPQE